jgi:hypothetical protein
LDTGINKNPGFYQLHIFFRVANGGMIDARTMKNA